MGRQGGAPPAQGAGASDAAPVLKMAKFDGYGLLVMGVPSMILACFSKSVSGFAIGALVAACGWCELDGFRRYVGRLPGARARLVGSQLVLIAGAWTYAAWTILHPEPLPAEVTDLIKESGDEASDVLAMAANLRWMVAAAICGVTLLYQASLASYYWLGDAARGLDLPIVRLGVPLLGTKGHGRADPRRPSGWQPAGDQGDGHKQQRRADDD